MRFKVDENLPVEVAVYPEVVDKATSPAARDSLPHPLLQCTDRRLMDATKWICGCP